MSVAAAITAVSLVTLLDRAPTPVQVLGVALVFRAAVMLVDSVVDLVVGLVLPPATSVEARTTTLVIARPRP